MEVSLLFAPFTMQFFFRKNYAIAYAIVLFVYGIVLLYVVLIYIGLSCLHLMLLSLVCVL